jgi:pyruvate,water dikinase
VVTTAAYERFVAEGRLDEILRRALADLDVADTAALERAAKTIRDAFGATPVAEDVGAAVREAYGDLGRTATDAMSSSTNGEQPPQQAIQGHGAPAVAVRSSATAEDLPGATFAGQQETFLNVVGEEAVVEAVRACWASLWSPRAIVYRQRQGVDHQTVKLAVVVQQLIDADVAGVLFTANPITGARDELVVDASPGLGEAVVSGAVTPDHYVLKKGTYALIEQQMGQREVVIRPAAGGGTAQTAGAATDGTQPALSDDALREIARTGEAIERHYGTPQDVEWAWADGRCYVLQARPVTALPPVQTAAGMSPGQTPPQRGQTPRRKKRVRPSLAGELFPYRLYPLDVGVHTGPMLRAVGDAMTRPLGIRFPSVEDIIELEDGVPVRLKDFQPRPTWRVVYKPWLSIWQRRHNELLHWQDDPALAGLYRRAEQLAARDLTALSWDGVVAALHEAIDLGPAAAVLRDKYLPLAVWGAVRLWLLLRLTGQQQVFGPLLSGVETKTLALNRALERLAERVRAEPVLRDLVLRMDAAELAATLPERPEAQAFWAEFQEFQRAYGHREAAITVFSQPSWGETPEIPLGAIKALVAGPPKSAATPSAPVEWEQTRDRLLAHSVLGKGPLRRLFLRLLERARVFPPLREDTHFYLCIAIPEERRSVSELARRLVAAGALDTPADVFFLTRSELEAAGRPWPPPAQTVSRLRAAVERRKSRWAALATQPFADPGLVETPDTPPDALLAGTPGSAGVAEGPVRIIRSPAEFARLEAGDVLVAPFTNPSWTPLFALASGVVVDTGGVISHAAIVAREYGVPAVMGTRDATTRLADGQRVRVDGTRGLVFPAPSA